VAVFSLVPLDHAACARQRQAERHLHFCLSMMRSENWYPPIVS
jgi:hypothetical protein